MTEIQTIIAKVLAIVLALLAVFFWGDHHGASCVQAKWDYAKNAQTAEAAVQRADSAQQALDWSRQFSTIATHYEATAHETQPSVADATADAVRAGTLRLSAGSAQANTCTGAVSEASAASRARDAAATQALADRVENSIAAVRAGDAADQREHDLDEQIIALQLLLRAERPGAKP